MSALRCARVVLGITGFVVAVVVSSRVSTVEGQIRIIAAPVPGGMPAPAADKEEPRLDFALPIDDKRAPKIIEAVLKHLKPELPADEWKDIIHNLQTLLDDPNDKLVDWTDPQTKERKTQSIRLVVNVLIGRFSKDGRDFYQREMGPIADGLLKDALEHGDAALLATVSQRYFHTRAGAEATLQLARRHLDRGLYLKAAREFDRYMTGVRQEPTKVNVDFMAALSYKRLALLAGSGGDKVNKERFEQQAQAYWDKVRQEAAVKKFVLGDAREATLTQLETEYSRPIAVKQDRSQAELRLPRGNPQNNAEQVGGRPSLTVKDQFSLMPIRDEEEKKTKGGGMSWIDQHLKQYMQMIEQRPNHPPLPAFFPIATSGKIIFRTYDGVYCLATRDDPTQAPPVKAFEILWPYECPSSLFKMVATPSSKNSDEVQQLNASYVQQGPFGIFFENGLLGSLSCDDTNVYFVDDMALPPHPALQAQFGMMGQQPSFGQFTDMVRRNQLYAVDLQTGKLSWIAGGPPQKKEKDVAPQDEDSDAGQTLLSDAYFLGAPLPLAGKLYAVIEKDRELRLVCLNPRHEVQGFPRPELLWSQSLGSPNVPLPADTLRRIQGISLAYSNGLLVVPTNAGAVLCIDLDSHSIVWARLYRQAQAATAQPDMNNMLRFGGGFRGQVNPAQQINADRWRISAPIISGDRVVFTAWDSNSILCLNLADGKLAWEAARSADDLYVAGVVGEKVLVAGKNSMKFLDLNKGSQLGFVNTGVPSGVGAFSKGIYFLPVSRSRETEPEIVSIDVNQMKVVAHTRSRKKIQTGNLVFYDGAVYSQTATSLTAFPQLDVKIKEAERRLAANPDDPIGLTEVGDLKLDDGKRREAIDCFNKALANHPDADTREKARDKLYDAITELLQVDFNAGEKMLDQYKDLCTVEVLDTDDALKRQNKAEQELRRKADYLCLVAGGREAQGRLVEALDSYLEFGSLTGNKEMVNVIDQPNTFARADVFARGRINHMMSKATPEQRQPLEARAAAEWEKVRAADDIEQLRNFVRIFGTAFQSGNEARLTLAQRLMAGKNEDDLRDAENILLGLKALDDPGCAGRATELLAQLYIHKELFDDAMGLFAELNHSYPTVMVRAGQTGADVYNDLVTDKRFLPYLEPPRQRWVSDRWKAVETTGFSGGGMQSFTIAPEGESIPFYSRYKITIDVPQQQQQTSTWAFRVIDRFTNEERFRSQPMPAPQYIFWQPPYTNNHRFAQIRGHLLILNLNHMVYAFDLADRKKLWEYNLFGKTPMPLAQQPVRTENEPDGVRLYYQDGWTQKVGQVGVIQSNYVCLITRDGLVALDPARGNVLWTKSNVSPRVQLMGDDNTVFVFESNPTGAVTSARAIRAGDGVESPIPDSSRVFSNLKKSKTAGRRVLVLDDRNGKKSMRLYDILTGKDDWSKQIEGNAIMLQCEDPNLTGYVSSNGEVAVFNMKDGKQVFSAQLDEKKRAAHMNKVDQAHLLIDGDRFFIMLNRPLDNNNINFNPSLNPCIRALRVNGHMYCFDRQTGKRLWFTDEQLENQQIVLDQFHDLPIVLGASAYNRFNNGVFEGNGVRVVALDKRTGCQIYGKELDNNGWFVALKADPKNGTVELVRQNMRIKFEPDHSKPEGPIPGVNISAPGGVKPASK